MIFVVEKLVYLAGPVIGLDYKGCTNWREYAKNELNKYNIIGVSPMRFKEHRNDNKIILDSDDSIMECDAGITSRARFDVMTCSVFLANLLGANAVSRGTMIEYGWADAFRKPIITVIEKNGNLHDRPLIREITGFRVDSLEEGLEVVRRILCY